ncbi:MAG: carbamoyltransferase C-terminal domain-containing protein [Acidobacteriota bacterium]
MAIILGLNTFHAGSSAAILVDGKPVVAIAEERLNRVKYYGGFPTQAILYCLKAAGLTFRDVDAVALGRDSSANLSKKVEYTLRNPTKLLNFIKIRASKSRLEDLKTLIASSCEIDPDHLRFKQHNVEHHLAHTASAYFISEWEKAAGFSLDGSGDFVTCMFSDCEGDKITIKHRVYVPHSLGSFYTMICEFIGYRKYGDEGKVMGLAPLGRNTFREYLDDMVILKDDGFELNPRYFLPFGTDQGLLLNEQGEMVVQRHYSDAMRDLFGESRSPHAELTQRDMDLAYGLQETFEKAYMHLLNLLQKIVPVDRVAMAGGCVLNSVANGKVFDLTPFKYTCIQPAAGDEGLALGAALYVSNVELKEGKRYAMRDAYLGPEFSESEIRSELERTGVRFVRHDRAPLLEATVDLITQGKVVGWFQGKMEWGPRALGNRSIVVHPGLPGIKDVLNARIKRRESFRPFAPSVLAERQAEIFEHTHPSPFMLHVYKIKPQWRERLVAVTHVDNTGRLQTVARDENPLYYDLIQAFERRTGVPVLLNTSFNENEPIVCSPSEAISCFLRTRMDALVIGNFVCEKAGE